MPDIQPKRTWIDLALAAGAKSEKEAELLLWEATAFPFASPRQTWYQLRHSIRHQLCVGDAMATCPGPALSK